MKKPEFNDAFAKTKIRAHKTFGGKVVEILYGAKNAEGQPCQPDENSTADGHGRWFGIEVEGEYTMFSWTHSKDEGGNTEYGTDLEDKALEVMESEIVRKRELAREAEILARDYAGNDAAEKMEAVKNEWASLHTWNTPAEEESKARLDKALGEYGPRQEAIKANLAEKEAVVAKAAGLEEASNFRDARNTLRDLRDQLSAIGSAGAEADAAFREKLNALDKVLREKQQDYMNNREANLAAAKGKKEEIVKEAKNVVANVANFKDAGDKLNNLFNEWKTVGTAGRDADDALWAQFNELRNSFRAKRQEFFDARSAQWTASAETKKKLIEEAEKIAKSLDFGRNNTNRMKQLDQEWRAAGYSGKDQNDSLWDTFNKTKEVFWDAKKSDAMKKIQAGIDGKKKELADLKKKIEDLEFRITIAPNPAMKDDAKKELYLREAEAEKLEADIEEDEKRISE